ncbi:MAG: sensor histidine kinase, partial [Bacteroidota bacterium]
SLISALVESQHFHPGDTRKPVFSITGMPRRLMVDPQLITQMVVNLVSNALKYSQDRQAPLIDLNFNESCMKMTITDFGIGIPERDIGHLFNSFARASNVDNINGTGLGLAIAKHIVQLHKGRISLVSKLAEGTIVTVELDYPTDDQQGQ